MSWLDQVPWAAVALFCLTLGLAPFAPPHLLEKLLMLAEGRLVKPLDWFDLAFHAAPWVLLVLKIVRTVRR